MDDGPFPVKRVYEDPSESDGHRVLVDRLWPRGITKEAAAVDEWCKLVAPSNQLRKWIHEDLSRWREFERLYTEELDEAEEGWEPLIQRASSGPVTLVYAARNTEQNHALVLRAFLVSKM